MHTLPYQNHRDLSHPKFFCSLSLLYSSNCQGETDILRKLLIHVEQTLFHTIQQSLDTTFWSPYQKDKEDKYVCSPIKNLY